MKISYNCGLTIQLNHLGEVSLHDNRTNSNFYISCVDKSGCVSSSRNIQYIKLLIESLQHCLIGMSHE